MSFSATNRDHELDEHLDAVTTCDQERATAPASRTMESPLDDPRPSDFSLSRPRLLGACATAACLLLAASMLGPDDVTADDRSPAPAPGAATPQWTLASALAAELDRVENQKPAPQQFIIEPLWNEDLWR